MQYFWFLLTKIDNNIFDRSIAYKPFVYAIQYWPAYQIKTSHKYIYSYKCLIKHTFNNKLGVHFILT